MSRFLRTIYDQRCPKSWFRFPDKVRDLKKGLKVPNSFSTLWTAPDDPMVPTVAATLGVYEKKGLPELLVACSIPKDALEQLLTHCLACLLRTRPNLLQVKLRGYVDVEGFRLSVASARQVELVLPVVHRYYGGQPIPALQVTFDDAGRRYGEPDFPSPDPRFYPLVFGQGGVVWT